MFSKGYQKTKPLFYSADVFKSLRDGEYIAVSAFPITATQLTHQPRVKPFAIGVTRDQSLEKLSGAVTFLTGRKDLGLISIHHFNSYVCVSCHNVTSFENKKDLSEHRSLQHVAVSDSVYMPKDECEILP